MNPLLQEFLGSLLRKVLTGAAGALVLHGYMTEQKAQEYIAAFIAFSIPVAWGWLVQWINRRKLTTSLATPAAQTEKQLEHQIANGASAPASTPKTEVPEVKSPSIAP